LGEKIWRGEEKDGSMSYKRRKRDPSGKCREVQNLTVTTSKTEGEKKKRLASTGKKVILRSNGTDRERIAIRPDGKGRGGFRSAMGRGSVALLTA